MTGSLLERRGYSFRMWQAFRCVAELNLAADVSWGGLRERSHPFLRGAALQKSANSPRSAFCHAPRMNQRTLISRRLKIRVIVIPSDVSKLDGTEGLASDLLADSIGRSSSLQPSTTLLPKSVTHVSGTICHSCLRAGPTRSGRGERFEPSTSLVPNQWIKSHKSLSWRKTCYFDRSKTLSFARTATYVILSIWFGTRSRRFKILSPTTSRRSGPET